MYTFYHYTSVEILKLILLNKTLRFKSLGFVDDPNEQQTKDFGNLGSLKFVSCWTSLPDSIPQWNMYGNNFRGIRLSISFDKISDVFKTITLPGVGEILPQLNPQTSSMVVCPTNNGYLPEIIKINYTDNNNLIIPSVKNTNGSSTAIDLNANGQYKDTSWNFQKEYRFVITVLPWGVNELLELLYNTKNNFGQFLLDGLQNNTPRVSSLDIELNSQILDNSNILFGPKCSDKDKNEIIELIKSLGLNTTYANSKVKIN